MDLSNVMTINGKPGLYKLVSKAKNNFIVESLADHKRIPAFSHDGVSSLDNIAIFTSEEDVVLEKVFEAIYKKENGEKVPDVLSDNLKLKKYFEEILPNYDKERVYVSNIKKVLNWYNILIENDLITIESEEDKTEEQIENKPEEVEKT